MGIPAGTEGDLEEDASSWADLRTMTLAAAGGWEGLLAGLGGDYSLSNLLPAAAGFSGCGPIWLLSPTQNEPGLGRAAFLEQHFISNSCDWDLRRSCEL
jgi:hypothetical protein